MTTKNKELYTEFTQRWDTIPPLVRAGVAATLAAQVSQTIGSRELQSIHLEGMPRREVVGALTADAMDHLRRLLVGLANAADLEAVDLQVNKDPRYASETCGVGFKNVRARRASAHGAWAYKDLQETVEKKAAGDLKTEIDKDIMEELSSPLKQK